MDRGYIKIWRKTLESEVFADPTLFKLWSYCLLKANHKSNFVSVDGIARPIKIEPGEFITGRYQLHKEFYPKKRKNNKSPLTLWRKLEILKNMRNLNIKTMSKCSIISIINWKDYQQNEQQMNITRTSREHHVNTNKNVKNVKKIRKRHTLKILTNLNYLIFFFLLFPKESPTSKSLIFRRGRGILI